MAQNDNLNREWLIGPHAYVGPAGRIGVQGAVVPTGPTGSCRPSFTPAEISARYWEQWGKSLGLHEDQAHFLANTFHGLLQKDNSHLTIDEATNWFLARVGPMLPIPESRKQEIRDSLRSTIAHCDEVS